ncbi:ketoacyl-ACP synthase III [Bacillus mycoides]|uniref:3-oxoacyl-ACP synthase III family protein n=1 Tax=Bacillus mycoides TaxID=1405 RepID=UPI0018796A97|nr:ketoacyl-ACP synthase III [Bacillus mycoides]MBE7150860.1 ketoacyl-ACP synthase III [Bacillus mycoides]
MNHKDAISNNIKIVSIGTYIPEDRYPNLSKAEKFGYDESFLRDKVGFMNLSRKRKNESMIDLCHNAFKDLNNKMDINLEEIQLITVVTQNPLYKIPHTSAILHNILGVSKNCMTFDISQGCAGYCHALEIVKSLMESLNLTNSLIFTCDCYSEIVNENNKNVSMIFGDGATATFLSREGNGYIVKDSIFGTLPESYDCLVCQDSLEMDGGKVFSYASKEVPESIDVLLQRNRVNREDIDVFILHQGSKFIVNYLRTKLNVLEEKAGFSSSDFGNTVSSSIPIQLSNFFNDKVKQNIVLSGFGVGFTWGNCLLEYS